MISFIVAYSRQKRVIGFQGKIPWKLSSDFKRFKEITSGRSIIMGRKSHESIGRALPGRTNVVLSRNEAYKPYARAVVVSNLESAFNHAHQAPGHEEVLVIGGENLFRASWPFVEKMYVTEVDGMFPGDTFFPMFHMEDWAEISREEHASDEKNSHSFRYITYKRVRFLDRI
jgi:dihydrofolate reductase